VLEGEFMKNRKIFKLDVLITFLPIGLGMLLFVFAASYSNDTQPTKFDEMALGADTTSYFTVVDGYPIHCMDIKNANGCIDGWIHRGKKPVILWLGNSQLHAINQMKPNDVTASSLLFDFMRTLRTDLITFSEPNANLQEHYVLFDYLTHKLPIRALLIPAVFDDTREDGLRTGVAEALDDSTTLHSIEDTEIGRQIIKGNKAGKIDSDLSGLDGTPQKIVESSINDWLNKHSAVWESRTELRGQIFDGLYRYRNTLFGITAQTKRKKIPGRYIKNMSALKAILNSCHKKGIRALVYIVPLRNDVSKPYVEIEYRQFIADVRFIAEKQGAFFSNLENLVPANLWGSKDATSAGGGVELDFMHFQGGGHRVLAEKLFSLVKKDKLLGDM